MISKKMKSAVILVAMLLPNLSALATTGTTQVGSANGKFFKTVVCKGTHQNWALQFEQSDEQVFTKAIQIVEFSEMTAMPVKLKQGYLTDKLFMAKVELEGKSILIETKRIKDREYVGILKIDGNLQYRAVCHTL